MQTVIMIYVLIGLIYAFVSLGKTVKKHPHKPWFPRTISGAIIMLSVTAIITILYPLIYILDAIQQKTFFPEI